MTQLHRMLFLGLVLAGCASLDTKQAVAPVAAQPPAVEPQKEEPVEEPKAENNIVKYSDLSNMVPAADRNYRHMTRQRMEEESELQASAGSLWVMDGQTSYLFSQNQKRREGDPTTLKMEGAALKLVESKVAVITDLIAELEKQRIEAEAKKKADDEAAEKEKKRPAEAETLKKQLGDPTNPEDPNYDPYAGQYPVDPAIAAAEEAAKIARQPAAKETEKPKEEKIDLKEIETIPSRIVGKTKDGYYRVRGQQMLMIKKKPYKVIATGLIRPEDFNDTLVSTQKMVDAQFEVVHVKRTE